MTTERESDKLTLAEKWPMYTAVAAQSWVIFQWYTNGKLPQEVLWLTPWLNLLFGLAAAVALDAVVVMTTMGRREGRNSFWSWGAILSAAIFSALVALDVYGVFPFGNWLHAGYPIVTFVVAQHLAVRKEQNDVAPVVETQKDDFLTRQLQEQVKELKEANERLWLAHFDQPAQTLARVAPTPEPEEIKSNVQKQEPQTRTTGESKKDVVWRLAAEGKSTAEIVVETGYDRSVVAPLVSRYKKSLETH